MPKLSEKTLEKRFKCDYCGETFRTRQGLSGHIQFKHQTLYMTIAKNTKIDKEIDNDFILSKVIEIKSWEKVNGLTESTNDTILRLLVNWGSASSLFNMLDIELTEQDFKTYLLAGLGNIFSVEEL